jgi:hypothetical protein
MDKTNRSCKSLYPVIIVRYLCHLFDVLLQIRHMNKTLGQFLMPDLGRQTRAERLNCELILY